MFVKILQLLAFGLRFLNMIKIQIIFTILNIGVIM